MNSSKRVGLSSFMVLCFIFFFVYLHRVATATLAPELRAIGLSAAELGLLSSMYFYAYAIMQIPAGILIDSLGPRKTSTIFTALTAVGALLFAMSQTLFMAGLARLIIGVGVSVIYVATIKILARWFRPNEVSSYFGILLLIGNLGAIGAATPLALATQVVEWRLIYTLLGLIAVVQTGLAWMFIRDAPNKRNEVLESDLLSLQIQNPEDNLPLRNQFKQIIRNRLITKMAVMVFVTYGTLIAFQGLWGIPYLMDVYKMTKTEASYYITLIGVGFCVGAPLFGYLSDKIIRARAPIIRIGVSFYILMWVFLAFRNTNLSKLVIMIICFGLGFFHGAVPTGITMIKESVEANTIGLSVGFMNIFPMIGIAIYQPLIGWILDITDNGVNTNPTYGYATAFQFCLLCLILIAIIPFTFQETFARSEGQ